MYVNFISYTNDLCCMNRSDNIITWTQYKTRLVDRVFGKHIDNMSFLALELVLGSVDTNN